MEASQSTLLRGSGTEIVTVEELAKFEAPPPEGRWFPIKHFAVYDTARICLTDVDSQSRVSNLQSQRKGNGSLERWTWYLLLPMG